MCVTGTPSVTAWVLGAINEAESPFSEYSFVCYGSSLLPLARLFPIPLGAWMRLKGEAVPQLLQPKLTQVGYIALIFPPPPALPLPLPNEQGNAHYEPSWPGYLFCAPKTQRRVSLGPTVRYPKEMGIRFHPLQMGGRHTTILGYDLMRRECQEAWSGIEPNLTECLTVDIKDITLDFRPMLAAPGDELGASHSDYTLPRLAEAII